MSIDTFIEPAPERRGAKSLLLTLLGEFVFPTTGTTWTSTIVACLDTVGITERNARQAIARLGDQGIVEPERVGRRTRWRLTDPGRRLLATGTERIYSFGRRGDDWDGRWMLVICSIPETQRGVRHQFRTQLTFEGFGFLTPTIAISPHPDREQAANDIVVELGLDDAMTFVATSGSMTDDPKVLTSAWDLESLEERYDEFLHQFERAPGSATVGAAALGDMLRLVDSWRRFPFLDPELPRSLLPPTWSGQRAAVVFDRQRELERPAALEWYQATEAAAD